MKSNFAKLFWCDLRFQFRYGFYLLYAVMTVLYIGIVSQVPDGLREAVGLLLLFSDPAACGLFFMGAMLLLEKSERVVHAYAVSPITESVYVLAKVASFAVISGLAALLLCLLGKLGSPESVIPAATAASVLFTLIGIIAASRIHSLNQFLVVLVPVMAVLMGPAVWWQLMPASQLQLLSFYPPVYCLQLMQGVTEAGATGLAVYLVTVGGCYVAAVKSVRRLWGRAGGEQ